MDSWIELANQKNGHDNVSVVLMQAKPFLDPTYGTTPEPTAPADDTPADDLTDASKVLLYGEEEATAAASSEGGPTATVPRWWVTVVAIGILFFAGLIGWWVAGQLAPAPSDPETESVE